MANQYFDNNENLKSEIKQHGFYFKGDEIILFSDNGVFSKDSIDYGSIALLREVIVKQQSNILDAGCGYGTIGITLAKQNPLSKITMIDVNRRAISLCEKGIEANHLANAICYESNVYENVHDSFDLIISNPPIRAGKKVVHEIIVNAYDYLLEGGKMWCVIRKQQGAASAIKALKLKYKLVETVAVDKGYCIIKAAK